MAKKPKTENKKLAANYKKKEKKSSAESDLEALQVTFYEIESWIEKTAPILSRMTKELEVASDHLSKYKKEFASKTVIANDQKDNTPINIPQQSHCQLPWKHNLTNNYDGSMQNHNLIKNNGEFALSKDNSMKWILSFQPGNLLRLDTNITSVEQLIQAVQKIRLIQLGEPVEETFIPPQGASLPLAEEEDMALELLRSSPSSSKDLPQDITSLEYWQYVTGRRPEICLEKYRHCRMNLNRLTKDISPAALNYIGQVYWDCLHPKFSSDWQSFWDRSDNSQRNQVCIDSGLAMFFLHVIRHDKDICENAQEIAGFYFDRARDAFMEFFDEPPDCTTIEALLNLSMFCIICKRYTQARIYVGLCMNMVTELSIYKSANLPADDLIFRKQIIKLLLIFYYIDYTLSVYLGESPFIDDSEFDIDFYELCALNDAFDKGNNVYHYVDFDNGKTLVKEAYFVHSMELIRITKQTTQLIKRGASVKQLLSQEQLLKEWYKRVPIETFDCDGFDYEQLEHAKIKKDKEKDILTPMDAITLRAQASLLLKTQYEAQWIILHKAILSSIRRSKLSEYPSPSLISQEQKSSKICSEASDSIVKYSEVITRCFGWCICQQILMCLYHASTVYCGHALERDDMLKSKAKSMIYRILRILEAGSLIYKGFPDDMSECLCEFLEKHGMHNNLECLCKSTENNNNNMPILDETLDFLTDLYHDRNIY
ncbi:MAG: hypothetical protein EXX96DRAFT_556636 [Benjaminiella poitrasii]|nr:MAG: hypothetical protein EXX96DRAFT_556636 [Benjaminiella poitrasii]